MRYEEIDHLRERHPAWALLRANHAPLILAFLSRVFVEPNAGDLPASEVVGELDDELFALRQRLGEDHYPRPAQAYLDEWAAPERGWLRKFYLPGSDEPRFDITPVVEKTLQWVDELPSREFVGTESRLNTIFELLRQIVFGTEEDPEAQKADLLRRRAEIDAEIARVERGEVLLLDSAGVRDRYQQLSRTARELLSDFREVEENFRRLDRNLRQQIAGWVGTKGELLDDVFGTRNTIAESDQGRSFQAFYDFLLSQTRQDELTELLGKLRGLEVAERDDRLGRIHYEWLEACERTQGTVRLLSEQLRRFLDDQVWLENRRVFDLLRSIEAKALRLREERDAPLAMTLDAASVSVGLPMERPLYHRPTSRALESTVADAGLGDFDGAVIAEQVYVDRDELARRVYARLGPRDQVALAEVVAATPLEEGLAELISYLTLTETGLSAVFDDEQIDRLEWNSDEGQRVASMSRVTLSRERREER